MNRILRYRDRVPGPELRLEDAVMNSLDQLFGPFRHGRRVALASLPIGAGLPDITLVSYRSELAHARTERGSPAAVLAYLRGVRMAKAATIADRTGLPQASTELVIDALLGAGALAPRNNAYSVTPVWKDILLNVVAVEAKVSNWRRALTQATRNLLFSHRSYVALPGELAMRVFSERGFRSFGIGVLGVDPDGAVFVARKARRQSPRAWFYYYALALHLGEQIGDSQQQ